MQANGDMPPPLPASHLCRLGTWTLSLFDDAGTNAYCVGSFQSESLTLHFLIKSTVFEMQVVFPLVSIWRTESTRLGSFGEDL